jgi:hypothetical protein
MSFRAFPSGEAAQFRPPIRKLLQENGHVIVGSRMRVAASARSEQNDAFDSIAVHVLESRAKARQQRIILQRDSHDSLAPKTTQSTTGRKSALAV